MSINRSRKLTVIMTAVAAVAVVGLSSGASAQVTTTTTPSTAPSTAPTTAPTTAPSTAPTTAPSTAPTTAVTAAMLMPKAGTAAIVSGEGRTIAADGTVTAAKITDATAQQSILRVESTGTFKMDIQTSTDVKATVSGTSAVLTMKAGGSVTLRVLGLKPSSTADVWVASSPVKVGTLTADLTGVATGAFTIPASLPNGTHTIQIQGTEGTTNALQAIAYGFTSAGGTTTSTTVAKGTNLPSSGPSTTMLAVFAASMLGALGIWSRRRTA